MADGPRTVGIVLTGMLHNGTAGLEFSKPCGGIAIVQEPAEAEFPGMPQSALQNVDIDYVVPLHMLGQLPWARTNPQAPSGGG
ncbi:chemotaxis response regulator CheB [Hymenobacter sp. UYCo722]